MPELKELQIKGKTYQITEPALCKGHKDFDCYKVILVGEKMHYEGLLRVRKESAFQDLAVFSRNGLRVIRRAVRGEGGDWEYTAGK